MAGETMKEGMKVLEPHMKSGDVKKIGKVVIGTVRGDLHDIGKNVVVTLLNASGFDVIDLGVDVPPEKFVEAIKENEMESVVKALKEAGLREKVKIIIGGAPITQEFAEKIGVDAAARDAVEGVNICKLWVKNK